MLVHIPWPRRKAAFIYPIPPAPRTAVLIPGYRSHGKVKVLTNGVLSEGALSEGVLSEGSFAEVLKFAPQAIAGTLAQVEAAAATGITLSHAIIVMGGWQDARLTEADRDRLWTRFRVPVFEQIIAGDGVLLAAECEAHHGLHIEADGLGADTLRPDTENEIDGSPCLCGRTTRRLVPTEGAQERNRSLQSVAAYAR